MKSTTVSWWTVNQFEWCSWVSHLQISNPYTRSSRGWTMTRARTPSSRKLRPSTGPAWASTITRTWIWSWTKHSIIYVSTWGFGRRFFRGIHSREKITFLRDPLNVLLNNIGRQQTVDSFEGVLLVKRGLLWSNVYKVIFWTKYVNHECLVAFRFDGFQTVFLKAPACWRCLMPTRRCHLVGKKARPCVDTIRWV